MRLFLWSPTSMIRGCLLGLSINRMELSISRNHTIVRVFWSAERLYLRLVALTGKSAIYSENSGLCFMMWLIFCSIVATWSASPQAAARNSITAGTSPNPLAPSSWTSGKDLSHGHSLRGVVYVTHHWLLVWGASELMMDRHLKYCNWTTQWSLIGQWLLYGVGHCLASVILSLRTSRKHTGCPSQCVG